MNWLKNTACTLGIGIAGLVGCTDFDALYQKKCKDRLEEATFMAKKYQLNGVKSEIESKQYCKDKHSAWDDSRKLKYLLNDETKMRCNSVQDEAFELIDQPLSQLIFLKMNFCEKHNYYKNTEDIDELNQLVKSLKKYKKENK